MNDVKSLRNRIAARSRFVYRLLCRVAERLIELLIRVCGVSCVILVFSIFFFVFKEGVPVLFGESRLDLVEFFTSPNWRPASEIRPSYGTLALLIGSVSVTGLAMLIAVPFGLGTAVYVSEFCGGKTKETLKIVIELLATIPSVVWGFVGYMVIGPIITQLTGAR